MYNDMMGEKAEPVIRTNGSVYFPPTAEEVWRPLENLKNIPQAQGSSSVPLRTTQKRMPPANEPDLLDRHNKIMAAILTRFRNMVLAATEPLPTAAAIPQASLNNMTMANETTALIKEIENLLALSREIKKLWIAGPLRKPGDADEKTRERELDAQAAQVSGLYDDLVKLEIENENKRRAALRAKVVANVAAARAKQEKERQEKEKEKENGGGSGGGSGGGGGADARVKREG
ncbi:hypothetical protein F5Y14DRAFT_131278 [Nemania sp. NC0429]|nr:hypothetical protein F5Y14DRAFT_131278 [Nemania sp. NC0429]